MNEEDSMKRVSALSFAIIISLAISSADSVISQYDVSSVDSLKINLLNLFASQIYSAAFNDISPGFDDLYIIKTQDKGREIIIYCNATYCYKNRNSFMTS
tara:strand:+ start:513 stop:812 length:300 start_codon:yes stop_codon:yes gene_type:complete